MVKILLDATFSGIPMTESFLREQIHSENLYENHFFLVALVFICKEYSQFEIFIFNLTHKVPPSTSIEIRKSLKRMPSLAYTAMDQTKYRCLHSDAFFAYYHTYLDVHNLAG